MEKGLPDGAFLAVLVTSTIRGGRRDWVLTAARAGIELASLPEAVDGEDRPVAYLARVIECDVPYRKGDGSGDVVTLLFMILEPEHA